MAKKSNKIVDWGALWRQLTTGSDEDVFPFLTFAGGERKPEEGHLVGIQQNSRPTISDEIKKQLEELDKELNGPTGKNKNARTQEQIAQEEYEAYVNQAAAQRAAEEAAAAARRNQYRGEAHSQIDNLLKIYDELISAVDATGSDRLNRIVKDFGDKMTEQLTMLDEAKYSVDANAAAAGLADSSYRSLDRQKVKNASDANIKALQTASTDAQSELGEKILGAKAKYQGAKDLLTGTTRSMLDRTEDESELMRTLGSLGGEVASAQAAKASYQPAGDFVKGINQIGNANDTALGNILDSIMMNKEASSGTKQSTMLGLINNSTLSDKDKEQLKNKYIQQGV